MAEQKSNSDKSMLIARGRLKEARKLFAHRGWEVLPQGIRGQLILKWVSDHAWLAYPANPKGAVRRHCGQLAPWLKEDGLAELIAATAESNKRWSHDQSATVLEISMRDSRALGFRFVGCDDDPTYERRLKIKRAKSAARQRKFRAANSTGRKRGRPKSEGVPAWVAAGFSSERSYYRHKARGTAPAQSGSKNASRYISKKNMKRDGISLPPVSVTEYQSHESQPPAFERGPPEAAPSPPPRPIVICLDAAPTDGLIVDEGGREFTPPPPYERRPPPKTWMDAAFEGYRGRS